MLETHKHWWSVDMTQGVTWKELWVKIPYKTLSCLDTSECIEQCNDILMSAKIDDVIFTISNIISNQLLYLTSVIISTEAIMH